MGDLNDGLEVVQTEWLGITCVRHYRHGAITVQLGYSDEYVEKLIFRLENPRAILPPDVEEMS